MVSSRFRPGKIRSFRPGKHVPVQRYGFRLLYSAPDLDRRRNFFDVVAIVFESETPTAKSQRSKGNAKKRNSLIEKCFHREIFAALRLCGGFCFFDLIPYFEA